MTILAFHPTTNRPGTNPKTGKPWRDADEFRREAGAFARLHATTIVKPGAALIAIDNTVSASAMRRRVCDEIENAGPQPVSLVAFFCHGHKTGIQFGFRLADVEGLAKTIANNAGKEPVVALYCCDTARDRDPQRDDDLKPGVGGDGGFADELRDALCRAGAVDCRVYGHAVAAHTTKAPWVRVFEGRGSPVGWTGGPFLVERKSPLWRPWVKALQTTDLRFRFPFMSIGELHEELEAGR